MNGEIPLDQVYQRRLEIVRPTRADVDALGRQYVECLVDGAAETITALRDEQPDVFDELMVAARRLERLNADVQEIEFTVEDGSLWLLQTRGAERSAQASDEVCGTDRGRHRANGSAARRVLLGSDLDVRRVV